MSEIASSHESHKHNCSKISYPDGYDYCEVHNVNCYDEIWSCSHCQYDQMIEARSWRKYSDAIGSASPERVKDALELMERIERMGQEVLLGWSYLDNRWETYSWASWNLELLTSGDTPLEALRKAQEQGEAKNE